MSASAILTRLRLLTTSQFTSGIIKNRLLSTSVARSGKDLRIAIIGQSVFGQEVYRLLRKQGKNVVGVFTVPDQKGRMDPLAAQADSDGVPLFKFRRWREKGSK